MYFISKEFKVEIGHRLMKNESKCKNPHGHSFKILVELCSDNLDDEDMVMDFNKLKEIMKNLLDNLDHCFITNQDDKQTLKFLQSGKYKSFIIPGGGDPTAERLSQFIFKYVENTLLKKRFDKHIKVSKVCVWETETSCATYQEVNYLYHDCGCK